MYDFGVYSNRMHDFIMDELELGTRVAYALDDEANSECPAWFLALHPLDEVENCD